MPDRVLECLHWMHFILLLTYVIDIAAISIILITIGQLLILLLKRALDVDSKKFPTSIGVFHVFHEAIESYSR